MSDYPQGENWWIASDSKWYPPELHPNYTPPPQMPQGNISQGNISQGNMPQGQNQFVSSNLTGSEYRQETPYVVSQNLDNQSQISGQASNYSPYSTQSPYASENPRKRPKTKWFFAIGIVILVIIVSVIGLTIVQGTSSAPWTDPGITSVADPVVYKNIVVTIESTPNNNLELVGLNVKNGKQVWGYPYNNSSLTLGQPVTINIIDGIVVDLNPDPTYPAVVTPQGIDVTAGDIMWTLPKQVIWDVPSQCTQNSSTLICMSSTNLTTGNTGLNEVDALTGSSVRYIPNVSRMLGIGLFQTDSNTPTLEQLNNDGTVAWVKTAQSLFNQNVSPDYGWNADELGNEDIISLNVAPTTASTVVSPLQAYTIAINIATGNVLWSDRGLLGCGYFTQNPWFICTGNSNFDTHASSDGPSTEVTISGLNTQTGKFNWSVQTYSGYDFFTKAKIGDAGNNKLIINQNGKYNILNLANGDITTTNTTKTYWCISFGIYQSNTTNFQTSGNPTNLTVKRTRGFILGGCNANLTSVSQLPDYQPSGGGAIYNNLYIFAKQQGLQAISI